MTLDRKAKAMTSREELTQRASELVPLLRERAARTEQQRQALPESIQELQAAGLIRMAQPERFGGLGLDFDTTFDIAAELGRGCGSTAWCYSIWSSHNWIVGMFPEQAQQEYWDESPDTLSSSSFNPAGGTVTAAKGGYQVSGRWDFSSGCDPATWVMVIGNAPEGPLMLLLPRQDYSIDDTWFVSGLRGSGSKDIVIENAFVPEHRTVAIKALGEARSPGRLVHDTPNNRIPLRSVLSFTLSAAVLGMAQGALETFEDNVKDHVSARSGMRLVESAGMQIRIAESDAEVRAARALLKQDGQEIFDRARRSELPSVIDQARYRRDHAYIAKLSVQATNRLFEASGGRGLFDSNALQRFHRDIHAASHHFSLTWDGVAQQYGQLRLGLEPERLDL